MDPFDKSHAPEVGKVEWLANNIRVVTGGNAGPMTFTGTRSYLVGQGSIAVIDPGPDTDGQFNIISQAIGNEEVTHVIVTHAHVDHAPLASRLANKYGARIWAYGTRPTATMPLGLEDLAGGEGIDVAFQPDEPVFDGDLITGRDWQLEVVHTPGHLSDHISLAMDDVIFSGDHVMGWATTMISPPDGDLNSFMASLNKLHDRQETRYLPGHGAPVTNPHALMRHIRDHRLSREKQIIAALMTASNLDAITRSVYTDVPTGLLGAAKRNVLAHLIALLDVGKVGIEGGSASERAFFLR